MNFQARQRQALAILDQTGMRRSSYAPPLLQILWRMGVQVQPPHFMGFWRTLVLAGSWFGLVWGRKKYRLPSRESLGGR